MNPFPKGWTTQQIEAAMGRDVPAELLHVPLLVSMDPPDRVWSENICLALATHPDFNVRGNAILGFGHLARTCGQLSAATIVPVIAAALHDQSEYVRGHAGDAADDLLHYLGIHVADHDAPTNQADTSGEG